MCEAEFLKQVSCLGLKKSENNLVSGLGEEAIISPD